MSGAAEGPEDLPTAADFVLHGDLDEISASGDFLGKSLDEAEAMFRSGGLTYWGDDLMWMAPRAFCYYVGAAIRVLKSDHVLRTVDEIAFFCTSIEFRIDEPDLAPAIGTLLDAVDHVIAIHPRVWDSGAYGDVLGRYRALREKLAARLARGV